jgi:cobalt-zinc-cadmium efflux system protein
MNLPQKQETPALVRKPDLMNLRIALVLNVSFMLIEFIGGWWTNSMAILTDALHDAGDSISLSIALILQYYSGKASDRQYTFGYRRFSVMGALANGLILLVGSVFLIAETFSRLQSPQDVHPDGMMYIAILGIAVNGYASYRLKKGNSLNEKMASTHLMEDVLGWVAVLIVSIVMLFQYIPILDPILTLAILAWVLFNVFINLRDVFRVILQATPKGIDIEQIRTHIESLPGIRKIEDFHIWSLDGEYNIVSLHLRVNKELKLLELTELKGLIRDVLQHESIEHVTIEFSTEGEPSDWHEH